MRPGGHPTTFVLLLVTWLAFGSVFVAVKIGVGLLPPLLLGSMRFLFAGIILYAFAVALPKSEPDPVGPKQLLFSLLVGASMCFVNGMVMLSSTQMDSWIVSILTCTIPLWAYGVCVLSGQKKIQGAEALGMMGGVAGIAVLLWPSGHGTMHVSFVYSLLLLGGAMLWGATSVFEKGMPIPKRPLVAMALQMIFCGVLFVIWSAVTGEFGGLKASAFTPAAIEAIAYLVLVASVLGYGSYMWLLVNAGPTIGNSFGYVSPAIAVLLGWLLLSEPVTMRTFAGFALIVVAVTLIVAPPRPHEHRIH